MHLWRLFEKMNIKDIIRRYGISTLGLALIAFGVALSIKSNLGIAPPSCPPTIFGLKWPVLSVGTYIWMFNALFIIGQVLILRSRFKAEDLLQIPAILIFGYLCDAGIWALDALEAPATNYAVQLLLSLAAVLVTAVGIHIEVIGNGWMLSGDKLLNVIEGETHWRFSTMKIVFDILQVALTALLAWIWFSTPGGNGETMVIREGTLILMVATGLCMKLTDPLIDRFFNAKV